MAVNPGIDYGNGQTNRDPSNGIRFGVISLHALAHWAAEEFEADYGPPSCPKCGKQADRPDEFGDSFSDGRPDDYTDEPHECDDYVCVNCKHFFGSESAFGDEPIGHHLEADGYVASLDSYHDIFLTRSPYYTHAQFCSPCAPGAGHLENPCPDGPRTYCLGHDWFEGGRAPYPVYSVADGSLVEPDAK